MVWVCTAHVTMHHWQGSWVRIIFLLPAWHHGTQHATSSSLHQAHHTTMPTMPKDDVEIQLSNATKQQLNWQSRAGCMHWRGQKKLFYKRVQVIQQYLEADEDESNQVRGHLLWNNKQQHHCITHTHIHTLIRTLHTLQQCCNVAMYSQHTIHDTGTHRHTHAPQVVLMMMMMMEQWSKTACHPKLSQRATTLCNVDHCNLTFLTISLWIVKMDDSVIYRFHVSLHVCYDSPCGVESVKIKQVVKKV